MARRPDVARGQLSDLHPNLLLGPRGHRAGPCGGRTCRMLQFYDLLLRFRPRVYIPHHRTERCQHQCHQPDGGPGGQQQRQLRRCQRLRQPLQRGHGAELLQRLRGLSRRHLRLQRGGRPPHHRARLQGGPRVRRQREGQGRGRRRVPGLHHALRRRADGQHDHTGAAQPQDDRQLRGAQPGRCGGIRHQRQTTPPTPSTSTPAWTGNSPP